VTENPLFYKGSGSRRRRSQVGVPGAVPALRFGGADDQGVPAGRLGVGNVTVAALAALSIKQTNVSSVSNTVGRLHGYSDRDVLSVIGRLAYRRAGAFGTGPILPRVEYLLAIPLVALALWLKFRPYRNGSFSELYGAPTEEELAEAGLPPRDSQALTKEQPTKRLFGPFPEDDQPPSSAAEVRH
jgi:hypothetical protein